MPRHAALCAPRAALRDAPGTPRDALGAPRDAVRSFLSAGYQSKSYTITTKVKPELISFDVQLKYPPHTHKQTDVFSNNGNLNLPEHTQISWTISCQDADSVRLTVGNHSSVSATYITDNQLFKLRYNAIKSDPYELLLTNQYGHNQESIKYQLTVQKDLFPELEVAFFVDTLYYDFVLITGTFSDDYAKAPKITDNMPNRAPKN